jgi:hypothetical protein
MKVLTSLLVLLVVVAGAGVAGAGPCTPITSVPTVITTQGVHCLTQNLTTGITSGNAITVGVNNVTVDLNGFTLAHTGSADVNGIAATGRHNVTVTNGTIRGFRRGVNILTSEGTVIEGVRADQNELSGFVVGGNGNIVRNNQVVATGPPPTLPNAIGIDIFPGTGASVVDNDVAQTTGAGGGQGAAIRVNATNALVDGNRLTQASIGILFQGVTGTGRYRDNLTSGVSTPFLNQGSTIDSGGNN